jgi:hypothetical protein
MSILPRPSTGRPSNAASALPVFADPTGRRRQRMRRAGACIAATLAGCLTVVVVGLLGGPQAPFVPWATAHPQANAGPGGTRATTKKAGAAAPSRPAVLPSPGPGQSSSPSPSPSPGASPRPAVTNRAGRTPPGRNRPKPPRPSPSGRAHAG